ncbi:MAG TPA: lipopolysaccharide biosynthesis protein [Flavobacteriales bacterium]|jgi:O-antigen/teichoic acid export membrane protein|nr:lipopolysaccharide biosynthesis protein [Flavobacteriales bacterium]
MPIARARAWLGGWKRDIAGVKRKDSFARNALYTFSDAFVNILSQIILTPIVASLYGPVAYGIYGLFSAITGNVAMIGGLGLPSALMLPTDERKFRALLRLSITVLLIVTALTLPFCLYPPLLYTLMPSWSVLGKWCIAIPWMVLVLGLLQIVQHWAGREKLFKLYAKAGPVTNLSLRLFNVGYGLWRRGSYFGLIIGDVLVRTLSLGYYTLGMRGHGLRDLTGGYDRAAMREVLHEYREYPLFIFTGRWLAYFALQLPILGISSLGDNAAVGHFTLASSLLLMPLRLFGYSLSMVFLRKATEAHSEDPNSLGILTERMYKRFLAMGVVPFTFIMFFGDEIFGRILGDEWRVSGTYTGVMGLFYLFRLLSEPILTVYNAQRAERALFRFYVGLFVVNAIATGVTTWMLHSVRWTVIAFALVNAGAYLLLSCRILQNTGRPWLRITVRMLALVALCCLFFAAVRHFVLDSWISLP